jgi:transposase InsO family protein
VKELRTKPTGYDTGALCDMFGKSRQAYYQTSKYLYKEEVRSEILLQLIEKQRRLMPRIGGRKLLHLIQPSLPVELSMGRDSFFDFLRDNGLLVRKRRNRIRTTYSNHWMRKYPNLITDYQPERAHQLWVSDITYIATRENFVYLSLVTDAYSRKIIGWEVGETLEAKHSVKALKMALNQLPRGLHKVIHHSDRGVQYCCDDYVKLLKRHQFQISMTENGDPRENAIAERVNGILKDEWLNQMKFKSRAEVISELTTVIRIYNQNRPHESLNLNTPEYAHNISGILTKRWKNYYNNKNRQEEEIDNLVVV